MKDARFEPLEIVGNRFGFVGKVMARYYEEGRLTYQVKSIDTGKWRSFSEKELSRKQAAA